MKKILDELLEKQQQILSDYARRIIPNITEEDLLQPNDYPELERCPEFRYEEGILAGMQMVQTALLQKKN